MRLAGSQRYEAEVPIGQVRPHPENPRKGSSGLISQSIEENGWFGAVLVQESTGFILAGSHSWKEAKTKRARTLPVLYIDVGDDEAARIMLADNRASDESEYHDDLLDAVLGRLAEAEGGLVGSLFDIPELDDPVPPTERVKGDPTGFSDVHALLSFPPELLGDVQAMLATLPDEVVARLSVNG